MLIRRTTRVSMDDVDIAPQPAASHDISVAYGNRELDPLRGFLKENSTGNANDKKKIIKCGVTNKPVGFRRPELRRMEVQKEGILNLPTDRPTSRLAGDR